jgi:hypothetical protein
MESEAQPVRLPVPTRLTRLAQRVPRRRYRRTEGIPRATGLHRRALIHTGSDLWFINRPGQPPTLVATVAQGPWWARKGRG